MGTKSEPILGGVNTSLYIIQELPAVVVRCLRRCCRRRRIAVVVCCLRRCRRRRCIAVVGVVCRGLRRCRRRSHCRQRLCHRVVGKVPVAICKYEAVVANIFCWPATLQSRILPLPPFVVCRKRTVAMVTGLTINDAINNILCSVWLAPYLIAEGMHVPLVTVRYPIEIGRYTM